MKQSVITSYKIVIRWKFVCILSTLFLSTFTAQAQDTVLNKYGLWVIGDVKTYKATVKNDGAMLMVDVKKNIPSIFIDLKYTGTGNFMHQQLYEKTTTTFLRKNAALALEKVQRELQTKGLSLKIWDAYRPYSVTEKMWEPVKDDRYAADPKKGSGHNRGIAVDLTLVDIKTGKEKNMGTGFDNFSDTAHHNFRSLPEEVLENRKLLRSVMEKYGFKALESEWWHYWLNDGKKYELLDLPFSRLGV